MPLPEVSTKYRIERDIKMLIQARQKEIYRKQLESQIEQNQKKRFNEENSKRTQEISILKNYPPFGRSTELSLYSDYGLKTTNSKEGERNEFKDANTSLRGTLSSRSEGKRPIPVDMSEKSFSTKTKDFDMQKTSSIDKVNNSSWIDGYFQFGKPGNGAPMVNRDTGDLKSKIEGNMWYNLDGRTPKDREERLRGYDQINKTSNTFKSNLISFSLADRNPPFEQPAPRESSIRTGNNQYKSYEPTFGESPRNEFQRYQAKYPENYSPQNKKYELGNIVYPKTNPTVGSSHKNFYDVFKQN